VSPRDVADDVIFDNDDDDVNGCGGCFIADQLTGCRSAMLEFSIRHRFYIRVGRRSTSVAGPAVLRLSRVCFPSPIRR